MVLVELVLGRREYHVRLPTGYSHDDLLHAIFNVVYQLHPGTVEVWASNENGHQQISNDQDLQSAVQRTTTAGSTLRLQLVVSAYKLCEKFGLQSPPPRVPPAEVGEFKEGEVAENDTIQPTKLRRLQAPRSTPRSTPRLTLNESIGAEEHGSSEPTLVDMKRSTEILLSIVLNQLHNDSRLKQPVLISRMTKGGKTAIIEVLCQQLRVKGHLPIYVPMGKATQLFAASQYWELTALVTAALLGLAPPTNVHDSRTSELTLESLIQLRYNVEIASTAASIAATQSGAPPSCVLILDDFHRFTPTLDDSTLGLVKRMFLYPYGRTVVYTSTMSKRMHPSLPYSRLYRMPFSINFQQLRNMSASCSSITINSIAFYGGVPALLRSVVDHQFSPSANLDSLLRKLFSRWKGDRKRLLKEFVHATVSGILPKDEASMLELFATVGEDGLKIWPLCYITAMLKAMAPAHPITQIVQLLSNLLLVPSHCDQRLDWKIITHIAFALRCLDAECGGFKVPLHQTTLKQCYCNVGSKVMVTPAQPTSFEEVRDIMNETLFAARDEGAYLFVANPGSTIGCFDGLVAIRGRNDCWSMSGYQISIGQSPSMRKFPEWIARGFLLGDMAHPAQPSSGNWIRLGSKPTAELMGSSLGALFKLR